MIGLYESRERSEGFLALSALNCTQRTAILKYGSGHMRSFGMPDFRSKIFYAISCLSYMHAPKDT